jgi:hypothetical protein
MTSRIMAATLTIGQLNIAKQMCGYLIAPPASLKLIAVPLTSAEAACGNAGQESSFSPTILGDGGVSYGLWQWQGSRLTGPLGLRVWCTANNLDPTSIQGQCYFFLHELPTADGMGDKAAWITDTSNNGQPSRSLETLTADICTYYERPSAPDLDNRIAYAQQVARFMGSAPTPAPAPVQPAPAPVQSQPAPAPAPVWTAQPIPVPGASAVNPVLTALIVALAPAIESLATGLAAGLIKALIAQTAGTTVVTTTTPVVTAPVSAPAPAPALDLNSLASTLVPLLLTPLATSLPVLIAAELAKIIPQIPTGTKT